MPIVLMAYVYCTKPGCRNRFEFEFSPDEVKADIGDRCIELEWPGPCSNQLPEGWGQGGGVFSDGIYCPNCLTSERKGE